MRLPPLNFDFRPFSSTRSSENQRTRPITTFEHATVDLSVAYAATVRRPWWLPINRPPLYIIYLCGSSYLLSWPSHEPLLRASTIQQCGPVHFLPSRLHNVWPYLCHCVLTVCSFAGLGLEHGSRSSSTTLDSSPTSPNGVIESSCFFERLSSSSLSIKRCHPMVHCCDRRMQQRNRGNYHFYLCLNLKSADHSFLNAKNMSQLRVRAFVADVHN